MLTDPMEFDELSRYAQQFKC